MYSARRTAVLPAVGFPIRVSTDHRLFSASSWLIAAVHALHRLLVPRHPPCALHILTVIFLDLPAVDKAAEHIPPSDRLARCDCTTRVKDARVVPVSLLTVQFSRSAENDIPVRASRRRSLKTQQHAGAAALPRAAPRQIPRTPEGAGGQIRSTSSDPARPAPARGIAGEEPRRALQSWSSLERR